MARGARRPKSAFRAELAELHALSISWRSGRTGMGTLTDARRGEMLLPELQMLDALELLAVASRLFPEGDLHGFDEVNQALACMAEQGPATGLEMAVWHLFDKAGWLGNLFELLAVRCSACECDALAAGTVDVRAVCRRSRHAGECGLA